MNKTAYFIIGGVVLGFVALAVWDRYRNHSGFGGVAVNGNPLTGGSSTAVTTPKEYKQLNYNIVLSANSAGNEVEVLQRMINAYNGAQTVGITGNFDDATDNALRAIINRGSTTLYEFRYQWLARKTNSDQVSQDIVDGKI